MRSDGAGHFCHRQAVFSEASPAANCPRPVVNGSSRPHMAGAKPLRGIMDERADIGRSRAEPEIIPPGDQPARWDDAPGTAPRIHVVRMGPVGVFALVLIVALLAAVFAVVLVGAL